MFIFDHAKDIWYLVISLCAITFSCFAVIFLYYLVRAAKKVDQAASVVKRQVESLEEMVDGFRSKIMSYVSYAAVAAHMAKKMADFLKADGFHFGGEKKASKGGKKRSRRDPADDFMQEEL
ncbi:MAG: hypothetical protein WCO55_00500 [Candidatus Falkowbacteria bacterium]